jgi:hypothetical protein
MQRRYHRSRDLPVPACDRCFAVFRNAHDQTVYREYPAGWTHLAKVMYEETCLVSEMEREARAWLPCVANVDL